MFVDATWAEDEDDVVMIESLLRDRVIRIRLIAAVTDDNAVRFEYQQDKRPGLPTWDPRGGAWIELRDDVGTEYEHGRGEYGFNADGSKIEGEFSFHPAPPRGATWLDMIFGAKDPHNATEQSEFVLRIPLPLHSVSENEWASIIARKWLNRFD